MRTTIDIPDDLLHTLKVIARDTNQTLSGAVVEFVERGMKPAAPHSRISVSPITGLPVLHTDRTITSEDVRSLEDEEDEHLASFLRPDAN